MVCTKVSTDCDEDSKVYSSFLSSENPEILQPQQLLWDSLVCANESFTPRIPEMGLELHSEPASLGTTNTGIVHDLDRSPSHTAPSQGSTQQGRGSLEHLGSSSNTTKKGNSLKNH